MAKKGKQPKINSVIERYIRELRRYNIKPVKIILYGSYARGTATESSDIDIVVISADLSKWPPLERLQILARATMNIDAPLEVLGYTPKEIEEKGKDSIIWQEISHTGKVVYRKAA